MSEAVFRRTHSSRFRLVSNSIRIVSRLAWLAPLLLVVLSVQQLVAALGMRATLADGTEAVADVIDYEFSTRVDVTYDYVSLRVPLPDGDVLVREKLSLPHSLAPRLEGKEQVNVRVMPGASQEVIITEIAAAQWRIAAVNAAMSLFGALLFGAGVFAWNRHLKREGDPGEAPVPATES